MINYPVRVVPVENVLQESEGCWVDGFAIKDSSDVWIGIGYEIKEKDFADTTANALNAMKEFPVTEKELVFGVDYDNLYKILGWVHKFLKDEE